MNCRWWKARTQSIHELLARFANMGCCTYLVVQQQVCKTEHRGKFGSVWEQNQAPMTSTDLKVFWMFRHITKLTASAYEVSFMIEITEELLWKAWASYACEKSQQLPGPPWTFEPAVSQEGVCNSTFCCHDGNQLAAKWCHWTQVAPWPLVMINSSYRASTP